MFNLGIPDDVFSILEFCDFDDEVDDDDGRGEGTEGNPTVFGGAAKEPGLTSLPAAWCWRFDPFCPGELVFLPERLLPADGIPLGITLPDIWLDGLLDADDDVEDRGIFETGDDTADPCPITELLGLK